MKILLRKIRKDKFDDLKNSIIEDFESNGILSFPEELIESSSEPVLIGGQQVEMDIDIDKYLSFINEPPPYYTRQAKVGMELYKDFKSANLQLPRNLFYEKEFWAYMSLTIFKDVVKGLRKVLDENTPTSNNILQYYFNAGGKPTRTGLLFVWIMIDQLNCGDDFEVAHTAFEFVDPARQVLEYSIAKNPAIFSAFIKGIIKNNKDSKFKNKKYWVKTCAHISCYASISMLEALDYDDLVDVITREQKAIISEK